MQDFVMKLKKKNSKKTVKQKNTHTARINLKQKMTQRTTARRWNWTDY